MLKIRGKAKSRRRAFTLLEVLMVILILGLLVALIVPSFMGTGEKAKQDLTKQQVESLRSQMELFRMHCGRFPTTSEGLAALLKAPDDEALKGKWAGPYLSTGQVPKDAWQHELKYESPGQYNQDSYDLSSSGPNGQFGDQDDITNWTKAN